jgi:dTDP-4-dehydrorhamnose reductase
MNRLLITGGSSYLGRHLVPLASPLFQTGCTYFTHNPFDDLPAYKLDVRDETAVHILMNHFRPDVVIHTVGSNRPAGMAAIIIEGTEHVAQAAEDVGARLIHISTDVIFDGENAPYDEDARPSPIHDYGRAKVEAETLVSSHSNHVIVRTSLIYGLQNMDHGTAWIAGALRDGKPVTLFTDQRRNPVWVHTLCGACLELANCDYRGIINVAGDQTLTRAEYSLRMLAWWGIDARPILTFGPSDHDRWPADCTLDLTRAMTLLSTPLPGVDAVLKQHNRKPDIFKN